MKIAFVSRWGSNDVHAWSGTPYHMAQAMQNSGMQIEHIGPLHIPSNFLHKLTRQAFNAVGKHYDVDRNPWVARSYAEQVSKVIEKERFDVVFSPTSIPLAFLKTNVPKVFWTDATFASMVDYYPGNWSNLSGVTVRQGSELEAQALKNCELALYTSDWAAKSACEDYGTDSTRVGVIPFGANIETPPTSERIEQAINSRSIYTCRLLFIGVDWKRKGGDLVVQVARELRNRGIDAIVDVVGCDPIGDVPDFVNCHGFISKSTAEGRQQLEMLLLASHFLFVPSIAECYGLVFAEAAAYGVPSLASATGGITTAIKTGDTGYALPLGSSPAQFAEVIFKQMSSQEIYINAARRARLDFEQRLNWNSAVDSLSARFELLLSAQFKAKQ